MGTAFTRDIIVLSGQSGVALFFDSLGAPITSPSDKLDRSIISRGFTRSVCPLQRCPRTWRAREPSTSFTNSKLQGRVKEESPRPRNGCLYIVVKGRFSLWFQSLLFSDLSCIGLNDLTFWTTPRGCAYHFFNLYPPFTLLLHFCFHRATTAHSHL